MKKEFIELVENIPTLLRNTQFNISLDGWPAAVATLALCSSGVAIYALKLAYAHESAN
ncbi:hypothetical protein [Ohessyouella blattaphilus]|uniref:Uncharacterized protein n=1 Tax=Ohessyouella blattaphilus TaxID=2949333 RepID=A0ABT1EJP3_9FIRM|nr:hypothetical protein [Ohessyouella blattaphilus]MCP1110921.1 hypothetical protein [Ohessyouella blattaphilus]MCR8564315.1 hypothetical protein [Ohessyouella blattaphilus]